MSKFFDQVKQGINQTGKQAQIAVEVNRIKMQINMKEKELETIFAKIGRAVFKAHQEGINDYDQISAFYQEVTDLQNEMNQLNVQINQVKSIRQCTCGNIESIDNKFCSQCGAKFE